MQSRAGDMCHPAPAKRNIVSRIEGVSVIGPITKSLRLVGLEPSCHGSMYIHLRATLGILRKFLNDKIVSLLHL